MILTNPITKFLLDPEDTVYTDEVINTIVKRMLTLLKTPEEVICLQDRDCGNYSENDAIYFISKGSC